MKTEKNVWDKFCDKETIKEAILNASKGKRKYRKVRRVLKNIDLYAERLSKMLKEGMFVPSPYETEDKMTEYGKMREIFKLPFYPDRCVQHSISIVLRPRWDKSLTVDTYACIQGRGINSRTGRYNLNRKVKRAIASYKGRKVYVLQMDISKCYPSVDNRILAEINRRFCKDPKMLELLDALNFNGEGLPIGNFLSQLWINIYLSPLDRYVKATLGAVHYFRYMDDIVILCEDKSVLHTWQWRIMNFLWYELHLQCNRKRQIYPLGKNRTERGLDFGGYVFRHDSTMLRKRVKKAFARKRHLPKSVPSYIGLVRHCDGKNLMRKIVERDNDMKLSDLGIKKIERPFEGDSIKIEAIIDRPIEVLDFDVRPSEKKPNTDYLKMQIRFEGKKRFVGGGYQYLCEVLKQVDKKDLPFETIIRNKRGYYFDGTIDEE